jgi:molybdopterin-synthase adenylyltransferase
MPLRKPLLPDCFLTWTEPPDDRGDEVFRIVSWRRSLTLKGHSFREFDREVVPLLDGRHDIDTIAEEVSDLFDRPDLEAALAMLEAQGIVTDGAASDADPPAHLSPQLAWLGEAAPEGRQAQGRLTAATVAVFGAFGPGAAAARALAAAGLGRLIIVDPGRVGPSDPYFSPLYRAEDAGRPRAEALAESLAALAPETGIAAHPERPADAAAIGALIETADLVLCCLESGELNLALKLNRACREARKRWIAGSLEGTELVVGPGFPGTADSACYMCWRMREVAGAANPESRFALERRLDRLQADLSHRRENLAPGADIVGGMLAAEAISLLTGSAEPSLDERLLVVQLPGLRQSKHSVLRKPGCPVCGSTEPPTPPGSGGDAGAGS